MTIAGYLPKYLPCSAEAVAKRSPDRIFWIMPRLLLSWFVLVVEDNLRCSVNDAIRSLIKRDFNLFLRLFQEVTGRDRNVLDMPTKEIMGV